MSCDESCVGHNRQNIPDLSKKKLCGALRYLVLVPKQDPIWLNNTGTGLNRSCQGVLMSSLKGSTISWACWNIRNRICFDKKMLKSL
jgi:hypothetical protein